MGNEIKWLGSGRKVWEDHPELFHYTNRSGLEGILKRQTLFATHYAHLNDQEEIIGFRRALKNILVPQLQSTVEAWVREGKADAETLREAGGILRNCNIEIDTLVDILNEGLIDDGSNKGIVVPYIFSFCSHTHDSRRSQDGLLSQWRGYAKDGGFAIVFETKKLEPLLNREAEERNYFPLGWGDVIYHGDEKKLRKELGDQVNIIKDLLMRLAQARAFKTEVPVPELIETVAYAVCIALYKHIGFAEENEVRIYAYRPCDRVYKLSKAVGAVQPQAEIHKNKHGKPYIELFRNFREPLPIKRIIVGPQRNKEKVAQELRKDSRLRDIVSVSGIPYIEQSWGEDN